MAFKIERAEVTPEMETAIANMFEKMIADYQTMQFSEWQLTSYKEGLRYTSGQKYVKVFSGNSVTAFIVNCTTDKKFKYGDILKPAGCNAPAKNAARGNVFGEYRINWTGPVYLR